MEYQECNLNIRYDAPKEIWDKVEIVYKTSDGWLGCGDGIQGEKGIPYWFSFDEDQKHIMASIEPSGLQLLGFMDNDNWNQWIQEFQQKATNLLGFKVEEIG
jgi:hypothetical protein